ncbi:protein trichome birefringence-like 34 [Impatiens glandulifera]|uniref:protein trichome birefringence-like 34 n=1 Tax=Impatiens glandulifera TaxID=253017 RepID=UPI001FB0AB1D|nr:protein trichome birefringence-like 34 [Impatiens glandulifera]
MGNKKFRQAIGGSCLLKCTVQSLVIVLVALVITIALYSRAPPPPIQVMSPPPVVVLELRSPPPKMTTVLKAKPVKVEVMTVSKSERISDLWPESSCDLFSGKWVFDNQSYPLYKDRECSFMFDDLACEKYGRPDLRWQQWRWQPNDCVLPRFNGKLFLSKLRNKRLMFVGDSLNRNQWVSLMCLVESSIPKPFKSMKLKPPMYTFKATEYNATIEFYWAPFLVESNNDDASSHRLADRIIKPKAIEKHAIVWNDVDFLVFNTYLWWRVPTLKTMVESASFEEPNEKFKMVKSLQSYKMVLKTWSNWIDNHINKTKTRMFFMGIPATHEWSIDWGNKKDKRCLDETEPISNTRYWGRGSDPEFLNAIGSSISKLKRTGFNIHFINITQLSEYRKDGHPSIYRKLWRPLTKEQLANPRDYADCTHWCLPGVPDVWNELLLAYILR